MLISSLHDWAATDKDIEDQKKKKTADYHVLQPYQGKVYKLCASYNIARKTRHLLLVVFFSILIFLEPTAT